MLYESRWYTNLQSGQGLVVMSDMEGDYYPSGGGVAEDGPTVDGSGANNDGVHEEVDGGAIGEGGAGAEGAEKPQEVLTDCLKKFGSSDFIMEPEIFSQLKKYFQAGGNPEQVIELLSKNYIAVAQMANLMAEWLILAGTVLY